MSADRRTASIAASATAIAVVEGELGEDGDVPDDLGGEVGECEVRDEEKGGDRRDDESCAGGCGPPPLHRRAARST
jgi:hypothetical protein